MNLGVSEIFGPTIQGEGIRSGDRASFLRLGGCNLSCSWCDTPYTWDWTRFYPKSEVSMMDPTDVLVELSTHRTKLLVITGGEPMLQQRALPGIVYSWTQDKGPVSIETNGTIWPTLNDVEYSVSPKLINAGSAMPAPDPAVLRRYVEMGATFKFVIMDPARDMDEVLDLCKKGQIDHTKVYLMPEASTVEQLDARMGVVADAAIKHGMNVSDRLHIRLWGGKRGH